MKADLIEYLCYENIHLILQDNAVYDDFIFDIEKIMDKAWLQLSMQEKEILHDRRTHEMTDLQIIQENIKIIQEQSNA